MGAGEQIEWTDELLTGVGVMDRQHRVLIDVLGELQQGCRPATGARPFDDITRDLLAYAIYHFETEERLIERYGYDRVQAQETQQHLQQHREFSQRLVQLRAQAHSDEHASQHQLASFLKEWLAQHIGTADQRLASFLRPRLDGAR